MFAATMFSWVWSKVPRFGDGKAAKESASKPRSKPTPELEKYTIDLAGKLVLKPEYEHENPFYRSTTTSGAFAGSKLKIHDNDPLDHYVRQQLTAMVDTVIAFFYWLITSLVAAKMRLQGDVAAGTKKIKIAYDAVATPAKKHYRIYRGIPMRVNERLEKENRAIKAELELTKLRLAEMRLQMREARLGASDFGTSLPFGMIVVCLILVCIVVMLLAWLIFDQVAVLLIYLLLLA